MDATMQDGGTRERRVVTMVDYGSYNITTYIEK